MTRKDYRIVAAAIAAQREFDGTDMELAMVNMRLDALAEDLATAFKQDNRRFCRDIFFKAAGVFDD